MRLQGKIKKVKVLAMDADGVLTDGRIIIDSQGKEIKNFDVQDGLGLVILMRAGLKTAIISARSAKAVTARARDLKIDKIYQNAYPKMDFYLKMLKAFKVHDEEVCYMGDDLPDVFILRRAGIAVAVPNAVKEVKQSADYITQRPGGHGAVREIVELILKTQGKWGKDFPVR